MKRSTSIWRVPPSGGVETEVVAGLSYPSNFAVAESGVYFLTQRARPDAWSIEFYDFATETTRSILRATHPWGYGVALSPDGSSLLYSAVQHAGGRLMLVEGFQ